MDIIDKENISERAYYGGCASPDRFLAAVQAVVDANIDLVCIYY